MTDSEEMVQAKKLYDWNRQYVEKNIDSIHILELCQFAKKQDQLYLMWADGNMTKP